jgi:hypothetical protein
LETLYQQLIHESTPYKQLIQRDIARTFPNSEMFSQESGQKAMERVLHAYSLYDDEINYCQGLAFLVGPLLMNVSKVDLFIKKKDGIFFFILISLDSRCLSSKPFRFL